MSASGMSSLTSAVLKSASRRLVRIRTTDSYRIASGVRPLSQMIFGLIALQLTR